MGGLQRGLAGRHGWHGLSFASNSHHVCLAPSPMPQVELERQRAEDEALLEEAVETAMQCCEVAAGVEGLTLDGMRARMQMRGFSSGSESNGSGDEAAAGRRGARR